MNRRAIISCALSSALIVSIAFLPRLVSSGPSLYAHEQDVHLPKPKQAVQKPLKYFLIDWKDRELKRKAWDENLPELAKRLYEGMTINDFFKAVEEVLGAVEIIPHECHEGWMWHTGSTDISIILGWSQDDFNQVFLKVLEISHNKLKPKIRG